jgi:integrase
MATIETYELAGGAKRYRVRYRTPDNRGTDKRGFTTIRDAKAFAATVEVSKLRGEYVRPADSRVTVGELGPRWLARQAGHLKLSSHRPLEIAWRIHVEPEWGDQPIGSIRSTAVAAWVAALSTTRSPSIVIRARSVLSGILADAVADRLLPANPCAGVKTPKKAPKRRQYLSHDQVWALASAAGGNGAMVLTMAYCGLRWGEAAGLRIQDLDLMRRRLTVVQTATRVGSQIVVGSPKSNRARTVPIPAQVALEIAATCSGKDPGDLVFPSGRGGHQQQANSTRGWWPAAVRASGIPRVTPHDLRHTCASLAVSAGANVKALQRLLGHSSAAMTLDIYADLFADDLDVVGTGLDAAMGVRATNCGQTVGTGRPVGP